MKTVYQLLLPVAVIAFVIGAATGNHFTGKSYQTKLDTVNAQLTDQKAQLDSTTQQLSIMTNKFNTLSAQTTGVSNAATSYSLPTTPVSTTCPITTCVDGSCSSSTGRGTCSWHGGEAY